MRGSISQINFCDLCGGKRYYHDWRWVSWIGGKRHCQDHLPLPPGVTFKTDDPETIARLLADTQYRAIWADRELSFYGFSIPEGAKGRVLVELDDGHVVCVMEGHPHPFYLNAVDYRTTPWKQQWVIE